jgi:hypothetical protein
MRFLIIITTLILFSCKSSEKPTAEESHFPKVESKDPVKTDIIEFTILKEGTNSGFKTAENKVINSTEELSKVWGVLFQNYMEIATLPKVDFRAYSVILITMGEQTSGGYTINIKSILNSKSEEKVAVNESKPGASCMTTSVMTYPFQLIMLPKTAGKISFEREESIYECGK